MPNGAGCCLQMSQRINVTIRMSRSGVNTLKVLMFCIWLTKVLSNISKNAEKRLHVDAEELRDRTLDTLIRSITTVDNRNNQSWRDCLAGWCKTVCLDTL